MSDGLLASAGTRVVIVGVGRHDRGSRLPAIPAVEPTADALGKTLIDICDLDPANLRLVRDPATPAELGEALMDAAEQATDTLLLYFVCHGLVGKDNDLYLATVATRDLTKGIPQHQALPYESLRDVVEQTRARTILVVLDCCFAQRAHGVNGNVMDSLSATAQEKGFYLLAAAGRDEQAWAPDDERYTSFSGELIRLLRNGDPAGPDVFTLDRVYRELSGRLAEKGLPRPRRQAADQDDQRLLARNAAARSPTPAPQSPTTHRGEESSPYRGLAFFRREDAEYFFGRDELSRDLIDRVGAHRLRGRPLVVTGPSGAGKSSLLRAGLIAAVERMDGESVRWDWHVLTPGADPFREMANRLASSTEVSREVLRIELRQDPKRLAEVVAAKPGRVLLVVDQFEELFTSCSDEVVRQDFVRALTAAAGEAAVVLGVRAGYFGYCTRFPELVPALQQPVVVAPPEPDQMREVIEQPAKKAGLLLEEGLVGRLLSDVGGTDAVGGSLPLLSHALLSTWRQREGNLLTLRGYHATGGIEQAIAQTADEVIDRLDPERRETAKRLLLRLVHVGVGTGDIRRRLPRSEAGTSDPDVSKVLDKLERARLVSVGEDFVEITHDALLRAWPRLREWIAASRAELLARQQLTDAATTWEREQRNPDFLLPRNRLAALEPFREDDESGAPLGHHERAFLEASRRQGRKARRLRKLGMAAMAISLVISLGAAGYALWQQRFAAQQRTEAENSRNIAFSLATARTAGDLRGVDPALAMQLGVAAFRTGQTADARSATLSSVTMPMPSTLVGHIGGVVAAEFGPSGGILATGGEDGSLRLWDIGTDRRHPVELSKTERHTAAVYEAAFDDTGRVLVTGSGDRTAKIWDVRNPSVPILLSTLAEHLDAVRGIAIAPGGRMVATASADKMIRLWDIGNPRAPSLLTEMPGHQGVVRNVSFSADGKRLASASADRTAKLWDVSNPLSPSPLGTLAGHTEVVRAVPFRPGEPAIIVTGSNDRTAKLWDVGDAGKPVELATLPGHTDAVRGAAFSPDGRTLATGSADTTVRLWDVSDPGKPVPAATLTGHANAVNWVTFSPDGHTLATTSADGTAKLWDVGDPRHPASLLPSLGGHTGAVRAVAYSHDGDTLATAADDGTARLWNASNPQAVTPLTQLKAHARTVNAVAFNRSGQVLATASDDGTAKLWDIGNPSRPENLGTISGHLDTVKGAAFSPDGRILATVSGDRTARLWDVTHPRQPVWLSTLEGHYSYVFGVAFSPDGQTLATVSEDRTLRLWDVVDVRQPRQIALRDDHGNTSRSVAFSPDGQTLVTASDDRKARLWDVRDPRRPTVLSELSSHVGAVFGAAFGADGRTVVTTAEDKTAKLWDVTDRARPRLIATLTGHTNAVYGVAFAPDGTTIATVSRDSTTQLWYTDANAVADLVCSMLNTRIAPTQWAQILPDVPFQSPCP